MDIGDELTSAIINFLKRIGQTREQVGDAMILCVGWREAEYLLTSSLGNFIRSGGKQEMRFADARVFIVNERSHVSVGLKFISE